MSGENPVPNILSPELPVFDLEPYLSNTDTDLLSLCHSVSAHLKNTGALVVKDPRVDASKNDRFLNTMEAYFARPREVKLRDARPNLAYQVGITPEGIEKPRCLSDIALQDTISALPDGQRPHQPSGPDPKWRYFWRLGKRPITTRFEELNAEPVIPDGFDSWEEIMNDWGNHMLDTVSTVSEMIAIGLDLDKGTFTQRMHLGPHLLAPTGTDLERYGKEGTVIAGFHNDLNFLTIHGKSRFPGLSIWLRDGKKVNVKIPDGCLLLQAGKQMEWLTGGQIQAGYHEVICTKDTLSCKEAAVKNGRSIWRVSSTVFSQLASDEILRPLPRFETKESTRKYPPMPVGQFVESELKYINLMEGP